ncbi:hypothetical protein NECID01_0459 [Nematocida sp. AWRm77]|nr:hypothetical protein NECID01_0459 [Nematocida sp. AWRm77]
MNIETDRESSEGNTREALEKKEAVMEKLLAGDPLGFVHGWRHIPEEIDLKKKIVYSLTVGGECLSIWAYKQILPFIEKHGVEEFERSIFPRLLGKKVEDRYTQYEIRQELEKCLVEHTQKAYGPHARIFFTKDPKEEDRKAFAEAGGIPSPEDVRVFFLLLKLAMDNMEETDVRAIEVLVFFGYVLDIRVLDYLTSYFHKENDFLAELLLVKMRFRKTGMPAQKHMQDTDVEELFQTVDKKEHTPEEEESICKDALLELLEETEIYSINFAVARCVLFLQLKEDAEIVAKLVEKAKNKQKAVRMQCVVAFSSLVHIPEIEESLLASLENADDDIKLQAQISISLAIPHMSRKAPEMVAHFVSWMETKAIKYDMYLPGVLVCAQKLRHPGTEKLYQEYCALLLNSHIEVKTHLVKKIPQVFSELISTDMIVEESLKTLHIDGEKEKGAGSLIFPSPEMCPEKQRSGHSRAGALKDLEDILRVLFATYPSLNILADLLSRTASLVRKAFLEEQIRVLFEKNPERNWRYWVTLMGIAAQNAGSFTEAARKDISAHLEELEKHWAYTVREEAKKRRAEMKSTLLDVPGAQKSPAELLFE